MSHFVNRRHGAFAAAITLATVLAGCSAGGSSDGPTTGSGPIDPTVCDGVTLSTISPARTSTATIWPTSKPAWESQWPASRMYGTSDWCAGPAAYRRCPIFTFRSSIKGFSSNRAINAQPADT